MIPQILAQAARPPIAQQSPPMSYQAAAIPQSKPATVNNLKRAAHPSEHHADSLADQQQKRVRLQGLHHVHAPTQTVTPPTSEAGAWLFQDRLEAGQGNNAVDMLLKRWTVSTAA
jgi:hypothetical protein